MGELIKDVTDSLGCREISTWTYEKRDSDPRWVSSNLTEDLAELYTKCIQEHLSYCRKHLMHCGHFKDKVFSYKKPGGDHCVVIGEIPAFKHAIEPAKRGKEERLKDIVENITKLLIAPSWYGGEESNPGKLFFEQIIKRFPSVIYLNRIATFKILENGKYGILGKGNSIELSEEDITFLFSIEQTLAKYSLLGLKRIR